MNSKVVLYFSIFFIAVITVACSQDKSLNEAGNNVVNQEGFKESSDFENAVACIEMGSDSTKLVTHYFKLSGNNLPDSGAVLEFSFMIKDKTGRVIVDRTKNNFLPVVKDSTFENKDSRFYILSKIAPGDSAVIVSDAKTIFGPQAQVPGVNPDDEIQFFAKIEKTYESREALMLTNFQKRMDQTLELGAEQIKIDSEIIEKYLQDKGLTAQKTKNGIYYIVEQANPEGVPAEPMNQLKVNYTLRNLEGKVIDTSIREDAEAAGKLNPQRNYQPLPLTLMAGQVISGWEEGLLSFKQGESGKLIIPSSFGYGPQGSGPDIPANSVLVFDIEMVEVVKN